MVKSGDKVVVKFMELLSDFGEPQELWKEARVIDVGYYEDITVEFLNGDCMAVRREQWRLGMTDDLNKQMEGVEKIDDIHSDIIESLCKE